MKLFCPSCEIVVEVPDTDLRCPQCHRALQAQGQVGTAATQPRKPLIVLAALLVLGGAAGGAWWLHRSAPGTTTPAAGPSAAAGVAGDSVAARLQRAGLQGDRAVAPGTADEALTRDAKQAKDVASLLKSVMGQGKLQALSPLARRRTVVDNTAALWAHIQAGKAEPVHSVEAAWLAYALATARGEHPEIVVDSGGLQTLLLFSRTRVGVRVGGTIIEPFASTPMTKPIVLPLDRAAAWWLLQRAHSERVRGDFQLVSADLLAAEALTPGEAAIQFARCVADLDQGMPDVGLPKCESALAHQEDPLARLFMAEIAGSMDQPVKAFQRVEEALKAAPDLPEALVTKGMLTAQRISTVPDAQKVEQKTQAKALFEKALTKDPAATGARAGLAQLLLVDHDEATAEKILREAVTQYKDLECAMILSDLLRSRKQNAEAVQVLETLGSPVDDERYVSAFIQALLANQQADKALVVAEKAHTDNPGNRQIALIRADLLRQSGRIADAIAAIEPLTHWGADTERMNLLMAQLFLQDQKADKALAIVEPIATKHPDERDPNTLLLMTYLLVGQKDKANTLASKLIAQKVLKMAEVVDILLRSGDHETAEALLVADVKVAPSAETVTLLGMIYTASGRKEKALELKAELGKAGDKAKPLQDALDKAITGAEAELKAMKEGAKEGGPPPEMP